MKSSVLALFSVAIIAIAGTLNAGYYDAPSGSYYDTSYSGERYGGGKSPVESALGLATLDPPVAAAFDVDAINFDIYSGYAFAQDNTGPLSSDGPVFGIGVETFYNEMFGGRLQAHYWDSSSGVGDVSASLIARFVKKGSRLTPYVFGGGGTLIRGDSHLEGTGHLGVGLDYRFRNIENMGLNMDVRRTWASHQNEGFYLVTLGLRFSF